MLKGKDIIGRPIVALDSGARIDTVRDLVFDHDANQLLALLVDEGGWFRAARVIPFASVRSIGEDAVVIPSTNDVVPATALERVADLLADKRSLSGLTFMTTDGRDLGKLADLYFDEATGRVVGYDMTGGIFSDLASGRTFVPAPEQVKIGQDVAIVPPEVALMMEEQEEGGLRGALASAGQNLQDAAGGLRDRAREATESVADNVRTRQRAFVVGKTASATVLAEDGTPIVTQGEVITDGHALEAERHGALGSLFTVAGGAALSDAAATFGQRVQGGVERIADATRERQMEYVTGRVAGADVTAETGEVLVQRGETVTSVDAVRADEAGRLGALVAAVMRGTVQGVNERPGVPVDPAASPETLIVTTTNPEVGVLGRRVRTDVRGPGGTIIAAEGQIVTPATLDLARTLGREDALIQATQASGATSDGAHPREQLAAGAHQLKEGAGNLLDRAREWLGEQRERAEESLEERRIQAALGRPVNRVILDPQDRVILNVGEIITHRAVNDARASGVLDVLLDSAATLEPRTVVDVVTPDEHGRAALPNDSES
ncbi:PRC-barrel domain-containing protein [Deinococcus maricopensis]|uniref:PRC-barrel domain protein n=1 Tax=Deinococcus maricopensis (strain DSM 21211 / LMG 22137 / NRRL B-23946 / LB-34) TaxID=709986 RepID=E8U8L9_DEIML|nr:PRC-barrel domain-containing protein [Deinococcus maricopensis]ADV67408.1 PRC-barrel domain protein [Deinococcus maricopensis DSM 21211]